MNATQLVVTTKKQLDAACDLSNHGEWNRTAGLRYHADKQNPDHVKISFNERDDLEAFILIFGLILTGDALGESREATATMPSVVVATDLMAVIVGLKADMKLFVNNGDDFWEITVIEKG